MMIKDRREREYTTRHNDEKNQTEKGLVFYKGHKTHE